MTKQDQKHQEVNGRVSNTEKMNHNPKPSDDLTKLCADTLQDYTDDTDEDALTKGWEHMNSSRGWK